MKKYYLGLSVTYHDPALAIVNADGEILYAEATERPLQNKRAINCEPDQLFFLPGLLKQFCDGANEFVIAINWRKKRPLYENIVWNLGLLSAPGLLKTGIKKLHSPLKNYQLHHMMACQRNSIARAGINLVRIIQEYYPHCSISFADFDHHLTHAANACYGSPFDEAACAVIDSYGEHGAMAFYCYSNRKLTLLHEASGKATASLGLYYMKLTELCGFDWLKGEEWKVMGLASYGKVNSEFYEALQSTIIVDGFNCRYHPEHLFAKMASLDQFKPPNANDPETAADIAHTGQVFFADVMTRLLNHLQKVTQKSCLTLAGGCALNSSYNGQITVRTSFKQAYIPSAPADDGCALGAAWLALQLDCPEHRSNNIFLSPYTGSSIADEAIEQLIKFNKALKIEYFPESICEVTAKLLAEGFLVGWIQGRAEFGPRALGNRSILADPRQQSTQNQINQKIKFREHFRPFAPSILHEYGNDYFESYEESPYMDKTLAIRNSKQDKIAAVCHVDGTGRLQTVKKEWNPRFHQLIMNFYHLTQIPMLLNTSFNVMGKPLVHSLDDSLAVFLTTGLDVLVVNDYLITKNCDE
jgi:carbamoyltransferase